MNRKEIDEIFNRYDSFKLAKISLLNYSLKTNSFLMKLITPSPHQEVEFNFKEVDDFSIRVRKGEMLDSLPYGIYYEEIEKCMVLRFDFFHGFCIDTDEVMTKWIRSGKIDIKIKDL